VLTTGFIWENAASVVEPQINAEGIHVWPFDSSFPIDVRFMVLGSPNQARMNRHKYYELAYLLSGTAEVRIQGRSMTVNRGDLLVIGSDIYHHIVSPMQRPARLAVLYFEPDLMRGTGENGDDAEFLMPFIAQDSDFPHVISQAKRIPAEVFAIMKQIHQYLPPSSNLARLTVKTYLQLILVTLLNYYSSYIETKEVFNRKQAAHQRLRPLFQYMDENYNKRITVSDAARICAMSSSHFMYFFKKVTGQSFLAYLTQFRIAKSQELLISTDMSISEICLGLAFCNQSYFGMIFRKLVGSTPLAYRRRFASQKDVNAVRRLPSMLTAEDDPCSHASFREPLEGDPIARSGTP